MDQKLSVIVPVFNCEQYLQKCIDSISGQTYKNIEIILVDDGSVDLSGAICDAYEKRDQRVIVIHQKNKGLIRARLSGAERASGEYITFVDGDDWIAPDAYMKMLALVENHDVAVSGIYRYYGDFKIKEDIPMLPAGYYDKKKIGEQIIPNMLWSNKRDLWELDPSLCTKVFRKELFLRFLRKAADLDIYFGEDSAVIFPLVLNVDSVVITHDSYYYHRLRKKEDMPVYLKEKGFFEKLFSLYDYLKKEFSQSIYQETLYLQLEHFYINAVQLKQQCFLDYQEIKETVFPFWDIPKGAEVVLYGAGEVGKQYYKQNERYHFCNIVLWADQNYQDLRGEEKNIVSPDCIQASSMDYILIAVKSAGLAQEIREILLEKEIPEEKIIWNGVTVQKVYSSLKPDL